jgi:hypothetical protein
MALLLSEAHRLGNINEFQNLLSEFIPSLRIYLGASSRWLANSSLVSKRDSPSVGKVFANYLQNKVVKFMGGPARKPSELLKHKNASKTKRIVSRPACPDTLSNDEPPMLREWPTAVSERYEYLSVFKRK